jgi:hypothetical protein
MHTARCSEHSPALQRATPYARYPDGDSEPFSTTKVKTHAESAECSEHDLVTELLCQTTLTDTQRR